MPEKTPRYIEDMTLKEISVLHGQKPAQPDAKIRVQKAAPNDPNDQPGGLVYKLSEGLTTLVAGHQHGIRLHIYEGNMRLRLEHAQAEGQGEYHDHAVVRGADGGFVVAVNAGHTHEIDREQLFASALGQIGKGEAESAGDPRQQEMLKTLEAKTAKAKADREQQERKDKMIDTTFTKAQAEEELDTLAKRCADELNLTPEGAMAKVLSTPRGEELYTALYARDVQKSAEDTAFDRACEKRIDQLVTRATREWDSTEDVARRRRETMTAFYNGPEFAKLYDEHHAKDLEKRKEPEPELEAVSLGLLSKVEIESDPQAALEKLAAQVAWRDGVTKQAAMASFFDPESVGYELLLVADAATRVTGS